MIGCYDENDKFNYENGFYLISDVYRMGNILAHYELYKKITDLPGAVLELGVFKGSSLIQFCSFRELLENENSRKIIGFDMFDNFPETDKLESDKAFVAEWNKTHASSFLSQEDLYKSLELKKVSNVELIKGNILDTLPEYLSNHPYLRISLLHIDTDVYEPAKMGLELLFDRVVKGGVVIFDDYGTVEGETIAVDEFLENKNYLLKKFGFSHVKPSYLVKD